MLYWHPIVVGPDGVILLNMVDTPRHAKFGYEVMRSLMSIQGGVHMFDTAQGVQAQITRRKL